VRGATGAGAGPSSPDGGAPRGTKSVASLLAKQLLAKKSSRVSPAVKKPSLPQSPSERAKMVEIRAATRLQARARGRKSRKKYLELIQDRQKRLRFLSMPILVASIVDIVANTVFLELRDRRGDDGEPILDEWMILLSLITSAVAIGVVVRDMMRPPKERPRFSLAHGIFFVGVLYRLSFKAARIDSFIWNGLDTLFVRWGFERAIIDQVVPLLSLVGHLSIFIVVTAIGKLSLNLVATTNACPHLLFPFQFFDFVFLYSFFSLRTMNVPITAQWVVQQCVLQITIIMRNSGYQEAITKKYMVKGVLGKLERLISGERADKLPTIDLANDPLLRLQYLARLGWQFDLADVAALIATPTIVSFFVWRDSLYTLQGTSILVRPCDLVNMWIRFIALMIVKPAASAFARSLLRTTMRKTLLGHRTMHGISQLAAKIMAERNLHKAGTAEESDLKVQEAFKSIYNEDELQTIAEELSVSGLNFAITRQRAMKKWRFYLCVVILQLFSAFPVRRRGPAVEYEEGATLVLADCGTENNRMQALPLSSVWFYVPPNVSVNTDCDLIDALQDTYCNPDVGSCATVGEYGWEAPRLTIEYSGEATGVNLNATEACADWVLDEEE